MEVFLLGKVNDIDDAIHMLEWFEFDDRFLIVMEFPDNCIDLFEDLKKIGKVPEKVARRLFRKVNLNSVFKHNIFD